MKGVGKYCIFFIILILVGECGLRIIGFGPGRKYHVTSTPRDFLKIDSVLGWKLKKGVYVLTALDTLNSFKVTVNNEGNRITSFNDTNGVIKKRPCIQVYGCSFTFGFSVTDTATSCYKLQQMLPDVEVTNKGIPGYSLTQMFLLLKQGMLAGDTPTIAVFNYATFQDWRTPYDRTWSSILKNSLTISYSQVFKQIRYPYMEYVGSSLQTRYITFADLTDDWPGRDKSAIVNAANTLAFGIPDYIQRKFLHVISQKTAFEIMGYCKANHIIPVFASVTPGNNDILNALSANGYYTLDYDILVWDHRKPNKYNCAPLDPEHPSGLAHSLYARKLFDFFKMKGLLSSH